MFEFEDDDASRREKCYTTIAELPAFVDPKQPPTKKSPFSAIAGHPFVHTVQVLLPEEAYSNIKDSLDAKLQKLRYARVFMSLSSLLEGDFFNTYIKTGNILMVSEGQSGSDNVFTLRDGILKLELGKEIFERTGLTGKPIRSGARKHGKERYLVELNLRLPSMLHGKKGFERIVWAFKNVLNQSVAWLFYDLSSESGGISQEDTSLKGHHPHIIDCDVVCSHHRNILTPLFHEMDISEKSPEREDLRDHCGSLSEWLSLVALESPQISEEDAMDPYLSRCSVFDPDDARSMDLVSLKWHGFISPSWIIQLFITLLRETAALNSSAASAWFALSSSALGRDAVEGKDGYTVMTLPLAACAVKTEGTTDSQPKGNKNDRNCICWEFVGTSVL